MYSQPIIRCFVFIDKHQTIPLNKTSHELLLDGRGSSSESDALLLRMLAAQPRPSSFYIALLLLLQLVLVDCSVSNGYYYCNGSISVINWYSLGSKPEIWYFWKTCKSRQLKVEWNTVHKYSYLLI